MSVSMTMVATANSPVRPARLWAIVAALIAATLAALLVGNGNVAVAVAPTVCVVALWVVWKLPVRTTLLALVFVMFSVDYAAENAFEGKWQTPLRPIGELLFVNLNSLTGVGALRFQGVDLLVVGLLGLAVHRRATRRVLDQPRPMAAVLGPFLGLLLAGILYSEVVGIVRGGNVKESLWQIHQLAFLPLLVLLFSLTLRGSRDLGSLAQIAVACAAIKAVQAFYFVYFVVRPGGMMIEYATSHSDSFLFVTAVVILLARWVESGRWRVLLRSLPILGLIFFGMILNDRRLAYVSLGGSLLTMFSLSPWTPLRRFIVRSLIVGAPVILLYVAVGWNAGSKVFAPVKTVRSLIVGDVESVTDYRDLENFNVAMTWAGNTVLGTGFGHEFVLAVDLPDISFAMPQWRYQPHNMFIFLFALTGLIGGSMILMVLVVGVFLAARTYHRAREPNQRAAMLVCISVIITWLNQAFGDMGVLSWMGAFLLAAALVVIGQVAVEVGAWPARAPRRRSALPEDSGG